MSFSKNDLDNAQRELLSLNNDKVYGVYIREVFDEQEFVMRKVDGLLTCYDNQYENLAFPNGINRKDYPIQLVSLNALRKGNLTTFDGKDLDLGLQEDEKVILASGGVFPYLNNNGNLHLLASFRDAATGVDDNMLTTPAGRLIGGDLIKGINGEFAQESLYIGRSVPQIYLKTDEKGKPYILFPLLDEGGIQSLINGLQWWLENKFKTLNRENDTEKIQIIEERLGIDKLGIDRYEDLEKVLVEIIKEKRFKQYEWKRGVISGTESDYRMLKMNDGKPLSDSNNLYSFAFFDENNNTLEYRIAAEITGLPPEGYELSGDMSGINLESNTPGVVKINPFSNIDYDMVPTLKYLVEKIRANSGKIINGV